MVSRSFKPSPRYMGKLYMCLTLIAVGIFIAGLFFAWLISLDEGPRAGRAIATVVTLVNGAWWIVGMLLVGPYYRSLRYEICPDEVIVFVGIWIKSVKHVPYRTVTNMVINRDILDRWFFGIGSLNIQTAGMSGAKGAEEKLVGLPNVQEVYELVVAELRRFRGGMAPTAAEVEPARSDDTTGVLHAILDELRSIRQAMRS